VLLAELVATSAAVAATRSRREKVAALAACLRDAAADGEVALAVRFLSGELRQRRTGVGWAALRVLPDPAATPSVHLTEVDDTFARVEAMAGTGSVQARRDAVHELFSRATEPEQRFLVQLVGGELRQGALAGIVTDAIARASSSELSSVRRAAMLSGDLATAATIAMTEGDAGLAGVGLRVGTPVQPMLAQTAASVPAAFEKLGATEAAPVHAVIEWKIDGVRVQVHRHGDDIAVYTRTLDDITDRVPEVVDAVRALPARSVILDGETIALRPDGGPRPFQQTSSRIASRADVARSLVDVPLSVFFFDVLHLDGTDLLDLGAHERVEAVAAVVPPAMWVPRLVTDDEAAATAFFDDAVARGHEGVVVKALDAPYEAGRRGAGWLKVKPRHTLDLVVLAAEWGHGRRQGWLSNLHLGARDPQGGFVMLGKTFKGLTDELLAWQTEQLLAREVSRDGIVVAVEPSLVVEIAFDGIQTSPRYPGGMALRFARVLRYRPDKPADEADTIDTVRALHVTG
jgi:DNA ligase-1